MLAGMLGLCVGVYGLLDGTAPRFLGAAGDPRGAVAVLRRVAARRPAGHPHAATGPTRGARRSGSSPAAASVSAVLLYRQHRLQRRRAEPDLLPAAVPAAAAAARDRDPDRRDRRRSRRRRRRTAVPRPLRRAAPGRSRPRRIVTARGAGVIEFDHVTITYAGAASAGARATSRCTSTRASCASSSGAPAPASRRCWVPSTGSSRTSPAAPSPGRVVVAGRDTATHPPRELADVVGVVGQDPLAGFVTDTVEEELAYGMEQLAVPPDVMRKRVEETLDLLGLAELRHRAAARDLRRSAAAGRDRRGAHRPSAGAGARRADLRARPDRRRGGARGDHPAGPRPRADRRAGRAPARARRAVRRPGDPPARRRERHRRARRPRCSRRRASRRRSSSSAGWPAGRRCRCRSATPAASPDRCASGSPAQPPRPRRRPRRSGRAVAARPQRRRPLRRRRRGARASTSSCRAGEITALMGRNGSGKSSLLWALQGSGRRQAGRGRGRRPGPEAALAAAARALVGLVPQTPADLLYLDTVARRARAGRPRVRRRRIAVRPRAARPARARHRRRQRTRATSPRASG